MALRDISRNLAMGIAAGAVMLCVQPVMALDNAGSVEGVVKNAAGQPVAGAFVRLKNAEKRLTFMVVSQNQGAFTAKDLPPGKYTAQAIGGTNQSAVSAPVDVASGKAAKIDVTLTAARGPLLTPAWPGRVPEAQVAKISTDAKDLPAGAAKALTAEKCTVCHDVQRILSKRSPVDDWTFTVKRMRVNMAAASLPDITDQDANTIVGYLSSNFKPLPGGDDRAALRASRGRRLAHLRRAGTDARAQRPLEGSPPADRRAGLRSARSGPGPGHPGASEAITGVEVTGNGGPRGVSERQRPTCHMVVARRPAGKRRGRDST